MESLNILTDEEELVIRNARDFPAASENARLVKIIERLAEQLEDFEAGQATPRGKRVFRNVKDKYQDPSRRYE